MTALSPYVFDATADNFRALVVENSMKGPVLVNYWAAGAGPCFVLMPRLVRLAAEYRGRFLLVMVDTDRLGRLAREHGVTSVPTVKVFLEGRVVETVHGAQSEAELRRVIDKHVARPSDRDIAEAVNAFERGDPERAFAILREAQATDPGNRRVPLAHAKLLLLGGGLEAARQLLEALPQGEQDAPEPSALLAHLEFLVAARDAPPAADLERKIAKDPDDPEARFQLAAQLLVADRFEDAMRELLELVRRDRAYRGDAARKGMLAIFNMLGEGELAARYRRLLAEALRQPRGP